MATDGGLRPLFRQRLPEMDWCTIESGLTGGGIPDSNCCFQGVEFWVEFKRTTGWAVSLRPLQVAWHSRRARAGGRSWIAVRREVLPGPRSTAADELWLVRGAEVVALKRLTLKKIPRAAIGGQWAGGPAGWVWGEIAQALTS